MTSFKVPVRPLPFFALTFLLSWAIWIPLVLSHFSIGPIAVSEGASSIVRLLGVLMPATAALLLTARAGGITDVRRLLGRVGIWQVGWSWWGAAVLVQPGLLVATAWLYNMAGGEPAVSAILMESVVALAINIVFLLLATLGEEIGWRGVALPALQERNSALRSSLILCVIWGIWHVPFWLLLDTFDQFGASYLVLNLLFGIPLTLYMTWFFNHAKSSLLLPICFHLTFNIVNVAWLPVTTSLGAFALLIVLEWVIAFLIIRRLEPASIAATRLETANIQT